MSLRQQHGSVTREAQPAKVSWWAVVLPLAVFAVLLYLVASPAQAGDRQVGRVPYGAAFALIEPVLPNLLLSLLG